jgi:hypothetical protein
MKTLPAPISDAERAVNAFKHELLVRVMAAIVRKAMVQAHVSAADIPEDIVEKEHRQGVASNAWNSLAALEIIERLPLGFTDPDKKIFGGRVTNTNAGAKGRWVAVYRLRSRAAAITWMTRNHVSHEELRAQAGVQMCLIEFPNS